MNFYWLFIPQKNKDIEGKEIGFVIIYRVINRDRNLWQFESMKKKKNRDYYQVVQSLAVIVLFRQQRAE